MVSAPRSSRRPTAPETCALCGLSLRYGTHELTLGGRTYLFCCLGCRQVFAILSEASGSGDPDRFRESDLFRRCREMGIIPAAEADLAPGPDRPAAPPKRESEVNRAMPAPPAAALDLTVKIEGMWCPACAWVIEEALKRAPGVHSAACDFSTDRVRCVFDPVRTAPDQVVRVIAGLGYQGRLPGERPVEKANKARIHPFCRKRFFDHECHDALLCALFRVLPGPDAGHRSQPFLAHLRDGQCVLIYGGRNIFRKARQGIAAGAFGMETLIAAGASSAYLLSVYNFLAGSIHLYFDTAAMLITLVLAGKTIEQRAKARVQEGLENFFSLRPAKVRICTVTHPEGRYVSAAHLQPGDAFRVAPGEIVPADGLVQAGSGAVDESSLTGEPLPVRKKAGDRIRSGTRVLDGTLRVTAEAVGDNSILGQMIQILEQTLERKTPLEGRTERWLRCFVPAILLLACGTGLFGLVFGLTPDEALIRAVTVMVIACPCALGIAIPLTRVAGIHAAGRRGLLVRDFTAFERSENIDCFVFDKTGTLTEGRWTLQTISPLDPYFRAGAPFMGRFPGNGIGPLHRPRNTKTSRSGRLKPPAGSRPSGATQRCRGPGQRTADQGGLEGFPGDEIRSAAWEGEPSTGPDSGIASRVLPERRWPIGWGFYLRGRPATRKRTGPSPGCRRSGYRTALVSGDEAATTLDVGRRIGIPQVWGGRLPQEKAAIVQTLQAEGQKVAMVGDGINDAPALAQADLALAVHAGSHLGREVADVTLMRGDPFQVKDFLRLARQVNRKTRQNLVFAFLYNAISLPVAMAGWLSPLVAVCAMLLSSLSVIGNTVRLLRQDPRRQQFAVNL